MKLIVDSGSTKTDWISLSKDGKLIFDTDISSDSSICNPATSPSELISKILSKFLNAKEVTKLLAVISIYKYPLH